MAGRAAPPLVTYRLPSSLDDEGVDEVGVELRGLAGDPAVQCLRLDCRALRAVSARGLGLLAAINLVVTGRGAQLQAFGGTTAMAEKLSLVGIPAVPLPPSAASDGRHPDGGEQDWTPWWTSASSNA